MIDRPLEANLAMKRKSLEEHLETAIQDENDFLGLHLFKSNRDTLRNPHQSFGKLQSRELIYTKM